MAMRSREIAFNKKNGTFILEHILPVSDYEKYYYDRLLFVISKSKNPDYKPTIKYVCDCEICGSQMHASDALSCERLKLNPLNRVNGNRVNATLNYSESMKCLVEGNLNTSGFNLICFGCN